MAVWSLMDPSTVASPAHMATCIRPLGALLVTYPIREGYSQPCPRRGIGYNRRISRIFPYFPDSLDFWIFRGVLESGRDIGGILDTMGSILVEYQAKRSYMDLVRTIFLDFWSPEATC